MVALSSPVVRWAESAPDRLALTYEGRQVSYGELALQLRRAARFLQSHQVGPGDVVALLMKNSAAFLEIALAVSHLGAVLLPINYRLGRDEVHYILEHSGAKLVCVDEELQGNTDPFFAIVLDAAAQRDIGALTGPDAPAVPMHPNKPSDVFRLMYTSGTTDRPKGVIHTYDNFLWKTHDHVCVLGLSDADRLLVVGPLYHVGAIDLPGLAVLHTGGSLHLLRDFDPAAVLNAIETDRLTGAWLAPIMLNRLLSHAGREAYDVTSLAWVIGGGERTPAERIQAFRTLFTQGRYIDAYGLTETCSGDTMMQAGWEISKIGSAGRAMPHVSIEIRDDEGRPVAPGQTGEICLLGPKVSSGYWRDPERTAKSFFGNWFRTGDMGYLDSDGFLFLVDRKKDMVISGGENIASSEIERVLYQLDCVLEAAIIGLPDPQWGERVVAVVVLRDNTHLTLSDLQAHCRKKIGGFKVPKQLVILESLPRNPSGKVLKRVLRDQLTH